MQTSLSIFELYYVIGSIPWIGPDLARIALHLSALSSLLTMFVAGLLMVLNTAIGVMNLLGRGDVASKIANFRDGKTMYWLRFFSIFNAKKISKPENTILLR